MKPDLPHTKPQHDKVPQSSTPRGSYAHTQGKKDAALEELSTAGEQYILSTTGGRNIRRRPSWMLSILFAFAAGAALTFSEKFEYRCTASFQITPNPTSDQMDFYRKELLDYTWLRLENITRAPTNRRAWFVDSPAGGKLRLCLTITDRVTGLNSVKVMADDYLKNMDAFRLQALSTPTAGETTLRDYMTILQQRLIKVKGQADALINHLPADDPGENRDSLRDQWKNLNEEFVQTRNRLTHAIEELDQLRSEPEPSVGVVSAQHRKEVLQADRTLQQDLKELAVNLTELKLYLLEIWQQSAGPLEKLAASSESLRHLVINTPLHTLHEDIRGQFESLSSKILTYQKHLEPFARSWTKEFVTLRRTEINAYDDTLLTTYHHIRSKMNDFLYVAARHLSDMRMIVTRIGESQSDHTRYYVLQSELLRAFQRVQSAHHRFEFAAGNMETSANFRLDTALKSSRGFNRRTRQHIAAIDRRLRSTALHQAREQHREEMKVASRLVNETRTSADQTIEHLVQIQSDLNLTTDEAQAYQRALYEAELATGRLQSLQSHLGEVHHRLKDMKDRHADTFETTRIELLSCDVQNQPVNLIERVRIGGLGAILTLFTVLLGQWWVGRRR